MGKRKLLLIHHFPLSSITGVTVMISGILKLVHSINPDIEVSYQHYSDIKEPVELYRVLNVEHAAAKCAVGVNLHIEVQWELSVTLARWCAQQSIPLYNYVQDYWPHHKDNMRLLVEDCGVRLIGASPFIVDTLAKENFIAAHLPTGVQIPAIVFSPGCASQKVIGSIGRLVPRKRFPDTVRAFCSAGLDKTVQLRLTVLPSHSFGPEQDAKQLRLIKEEFERPGVDSGSINIITTPMVPPDYSSLSIYVSASDYEGFSMTPYEAAYVGCPPIVSDIPPHVFMAKALFADRFEDFLYPVKDTNALAKQLHDEIMTGRRRRYLEEHKVRVRELIETRFSYRGTAEALVQLCVESDVIR